MKSYSIEQQWHDILLKGEMYVIDDRTRIVVMTEPYKGLSKKIHWRGKEPYPFSIDVMLQRGAFELINLYDQQSKNSKKQ